MFGKFKNSKKSRINLFRPFLWTNALLGGWVVKGQPQPPQFL